MLNREQLYKKTEEKLFKAYYNDELAHGKCYACAVGNILDGTDEWANLFLSSGYKEDGKTVAIKQKIAKEGEILMFTNFILSGWVNRRIDELGGQKEEAIGRIEKANEQIRNSGYTKEELMRIENVFETAEQGENSEDWMFNGLVAVLDVLKEIHGIDDNSEEINKFTKEYERKLELV